MTASMTECRSGRAPAPGVTDGQSAGLRLLRWLVGCATLVLVTACGGDDATGNGEVPG